MPDPSALSGRPAIPSEPPIPDRSGTDLAAAFAGTAFPGELRPYQQLAIAAFERARASGDRRLYLTLPPGSGKTLVGLEILRRLGRPAVILAPNTAIVGQWLDQWSRFEPAIVDAADTTDLAAPITVLTYQAVCVLDRDVEFAGDPCSDRRRLTEHHEHRLHADRPERDVRRRHAHGHEQVVALGTARRERAVGDAVRARHAHLHVSSEGLVHSHEHSHDAEHAQRHPTSGSAAAAPWIMFLIFVFGPCEPLIPLLMYPAAEANLAGSVLVAGVFGVATLATMLSMVAIGYLGLARLAHGMLERYAHAACGGAIAACGAAVVFGL